MQEWCRCGWLCRHQSADRVVRVQLVHGLWFQSYALLSLHLDTYVWISSHLHPRTPPASAQVDVIRLSAQPTQRLPATLRVLKVSSLCGGKPIDEPLSIHARAHVVQHTCMPPRVGGVQTGTLSCPHSCTGGDRDCLRYSRVTLTPHPPGVPAGPHGPAPPGVHAAGAAGAPGGEGRAGR